MKKILCMIVLALTLSIAYGQAPGLLNYQGVARNSVGNVLQNKNISLRLSIHDGTATGTLVYTETRTVTTNPFGLFNVQVGSPSATNVTGTINGVNWALGNKYIQVEIDPGGGSSFINIGSSQLASVPYALAAAGAPPTGAATGDLSGIYPAPLVARLQNRPLSNTAPVNGQAIVWNSSGNTWQPGTPDVSSAGWSLNGNSGTTPAAQFLGTADNRPLRFRLNNRWAGELNATTGNYFIGLDAGNATTTGQYNTAIGNGALRNNTNGHENTANGTQALYLNTSGSYNTANGGFALYANTTGDYNTANGYWALYANTTGKYNTANGIEALYANTTGYSNTANGMAALYVNSTGYENTANGVYALRSNTTGFRNTANGSEALYSNTTGDANTANGGGALYDNTSGHSNTANGGDALHSNTTGNYNTASGGDALHSNTIGNGNTAIGNGALGLNTIGGSNTAIGYAALSYNGEGSDNTAVGSYSGPIGVAAPSNTTCIGSGAVVRASNCIRLGNSSVTSISGQVAFTATSDKRVKEDILENVPGVDFIMKLRPVTYRFNVLKQEAITRPGLAQASLTENPHKYDIEKIRYTGLLAQEVEEAAKQVSYNFSGVTKPQNENDLYTLRYTDLIMPLIKGMQEQQQLIEKQNKQIEQQQQQYEALLKRMIILEKKISTPI